MKRARFSGRANTNLVEIARYIGLESKSPKTARNFVNALRDRCHKLASLKGQLGRARDELEPGLRSVAFKSYVIFFRYIDDNVEVVTVLHGMRDIDDLVGDDPTSSPHP